MPKTNLDKTLGKILLEELVKLAQDFAQLLTKTRNKTRKAKI